MLLECVLLLSVELVVWREGGGSGAAIGIGSLLNGVRYGGVSLMP